jgi:hypothetical protein
LKPETFPIIQQLPIRHKKTAGLNPAVSAFSIDKEQKRKSSGKLQTVFKIID